MKLYHDPGGDLYSLLVVGKNGKMQRLYAPFKVICIKSTGTIPEKTQVYVDAIAGTPEGKIYFIIFHQPHAHFHFQIHTRF